MRQSNLQPFSNFGESLKRLRESRSKTPIEVSGAVEIDVKSLEAFEQGSQRPSEDILLLLIQHFDLEDIEADELWRLAGYGEAIDDSSYFSNDDSSLVRSSKTENNQRNNQTIVYTDLIQVMVNNFGVVVNFMQGAGLHEKPLAVARVGMSKEHARSVIEVLRKTLDQADEVQHTAVPKQLPSSSSHKD